MRFVFYIVQKLGDDTCFSFEVGLSWISFLLALDPTGFSLIFFYMVKRKYIYETFFILYEN
jgi:hypothetical protein